MSSNGKLLRILGAAVLLIVVQFAAVVAEAHAGHSHGHDGSVDAHGLQPHAPGAVAGVGLAISDDETGPAKRVTQPEDQVQTANQVETILQAAQVGAPGGSGTCVIGCCGTGMGCCGAALAAVSPNLPAGAGSLRVGLARATFVREVDPGGLRKPPRSLA
jgi:hypothetical protein